jgi:oxygen-dependent protoporphyrinogen oxidase
MSTGARSFAVVGGGVSGMATAFQLASLGHSVELLERDERIGGRCRPALLGAREITFGGKNIGRRYELFRHFTAAMGDHPYEYFGINSARVENGRIRTFDSTKRLRSLLGLGSRMTPRDAVRFARAGMLARRDGENRYLGSPAFASLGGSRDPLLREWFSERCCRAILRPITVRMNGAEPDEAHLGNFGTNIGMLLDSYDQLTHGIGPVLERFAASHRVSTRAEVTGLVVEEGEVRGLRVRDASGETETRRYDGVVLATPAGPAADLVREHNSYLAADLTAVRYFPAAVAVVSYDRPVFSHEVRALVFGPDAPLSNAGVYGIDDRETVRYTFSGRSARAHIDSAEPEELVGLAEELLGRYVSLGGARRIEVAFQRWPRAYCAYLPHHAEFLARVRRGTARVPGLGLAGDYMRGASIEACFRSAREAAIALHSDRRVRRAAVERAGAAMP